MAVCCCCLFAKVLEYQNVNVTSALPSTRHTCKYDPRSDARAAEMCILASHISSAPGLEADDHVCDLHVSLLLQVSQDSSSEEDLALADAVQVLVQLQRFDLMR